MMSFSRIVILFFVAVVIVSCEPGTRRIFPPTTDQGSGNADTDEVFLDSDDLLPDEPGSDTGETETDPLVNDDGQLVNDDGELVNDDGQLINDDGQVVNDDGQVVNDDGEVVTDDIVNDEVVTDEVATDDVTTDDILTDGIATDDGTVVTDDGTVVADDGTVITDDAVVPDVDVDTCECSTGACCDGCHFRTADSNYVCRSAAHPVCDVVETCPGNSAACPPDGFAPDTTPCDDGVFCNGDDTCNGNSAACDVHDGFFCGNFVCSESQGKCCDAGWAGADCEICVRFVKTTPAPGTPDGLSWNTAFNDLQAAIDSANGSSAATCEVWVAAGTYYAYKNATGNYIQLRGKVPFYGGFAGTEALRESRDWTVNATIIDGRQSSGGSDRVSHILYGAAGALMDGFTVQEGRAVTGSGSGNIVEGGAMYLNNASMTVRNCIFRNNSAVVQTGDDTARGGAIAIIGGGSSLFENCLFFKNTVTAGNYDVAFGGAIYATGGGTTTVRNCVFSENTITGGTSTEAGGGALNGYGTGTVLEVVNSLFYSNTVTAPTANGGAIRANDASAIQITNSTFSKNSAEDSGGAVANMGGTGTTIVNSIFWADAAATVQNNTDELWDEGGGGTIAATYSDIQMTNDSNLSGTGNIHADPLFVDAPNNDFHLIADPVGMQISPCIDFASDASAPTTDLEGKTRFDVPMYGTGTADMGCYEFVY
ncbi:MAG TPA: hypothetical protein PKH10_10460 [bacterium]|nr:hypothetical protein [bacterium]